MDHLATPSPLQSTLPFPRTTHDCTLPSKQLPIHWPTRSRAREPRVSSSSAPPSKKNHCITTEWSTAMADDATQEPAAEPGQGSLQTSSATATADQPTAATSFPLFAFLPEEIRRMIWQHACFPTRIHYLGFPKTCTLPPVGLLSDPARAPHLTYDGVRDDLAMLIANSDNYKQQWSVSGCKKFRSFYWRRDLNRVGAVCPEARDAYLNLVNQNSVAIKKGIHVNESFDIFHFSSLVSNRDLTAFLLTLRPRLCRKSKPLSAGSLYGTMVP